MARGPWVAHPCSNTKRDNIADIFFDRKTLEDIGEEALLGSDTSEDTVRDMPLDNVMLPAFALQVRLFRYYNSLCDQPVVNTT